MTPIRVCRRDKTQEKGFIVAFVTGDEDGFEVLAVVVWDDGSLYATGLPNLKVLVPIRG